MMQAVSNQAPNPDVRTDPFTVPIWLYGAIACVAGLLAVTSQTFWIDEACTAIIAQQGRLQDWWAYLLADRSSDLQMPLYSFWIWVCEKLFGASEPALRSVNLFWFVPALIISMWSFEKNRPLQLAVFLTAAFSPFAWYYLNEARSYTMQWSTSLMVFACLYHWTQTLKTPIELERPWAWGFAVALVLLCGSSMLAMIWATIPLAIMFILLPKDRLLQLGRTFTPTWLVTSVFLAALAVYYLWTLSIGARATNVATTGLKNVFFIAYELLGFGGLGPGRLEIREAGLHVFKSHVVWLTTFATLVAILAGLASRHLSQKYSRAKLWLLVLAVAAPAGFILGAGAGLHFRVLGRHCAPLAPLAFLLLALGVTGAWRRGRFWRMAVVFFFAVYLTSALSFRLAARHGRDDYRTAAAMGKAALARGENVWWNAAMNGAIYYGLPITNRSNENGRALSLPNPTREVIAGSGRADMIITSRRDVYDSHGVLAEFIARENYQRVTNLMAFTVWRRPAN